LKDRNGQARTCTASQGKAIQSKIRQVQESLGKTRKGKAGLSKARVG
jgi:hypothetical protein